MDLTKLEGIADLINSETEQQRKQAVKQMNGELNTLYTSWRSKLVKCLAYVEALIDFGEDAEITDEILVQVQKPVQEVINEINKHLNDNRRGERLRNGITITICGPPNSGKSSLLNKLIQRKAAIVSSTPGTTRDVIDIPFNCKLYIFSLN